jgi:hypothetical protein
MSTEFSPFNLDSSANKRVRRELEKFKKTFQPSVPFTFSFSSQPVNTSSIRWEDLQGVEFSQNGPVPLFFCAFSAHTACTVKGISNPVEDLLTNEFYSSLSVHTLNLRLVQHSDPEFRQLISAVEKASVQDIFVENGMWKELDRPFLIVQDYLPGVYLLGMGKERARQCFAEDPALGFRRLREIGEIIAVDIWMNNSARVPVLWEAEGSANGFFVSVRAEGLSSDEILSPDVPLTMMNVYAIDSAHCPISEFDEHTYSSYLEKVQRFVRGTVRDLDDALLGKTFGMMQLPTMERVSEFFYKHLGVELGSQQLFEVLKGVMGTFKEIAEMEEGEVRGICEGVRRMCRKDWMDVWRNEVEKIGEEFVLDVKKCIAEVVFDNQKSFEWVYMMYKTSGIL